MNVNINYTFSEKEVAHAIYDIEHSNTITQLDLMALIYASQKWLDMKEECRKDPSYQWGYGHIIY